VDQRAAWRSAAAGCIAAVLVATVVPLCLLQIPFGGLPQLAGAGAAAGAAGSVGALLRSGGLALPFLVASAPLSGLAVRRFQAWPVLLSGLFVIMGGDDLAAHDGVHAATSTALAGTASALHGIGAGLALLATAALVAECREPAERRELAERRDPAEHREPPESRELAWRAVWPRRPLAAWWVAVTVSALAVLPGLSRAEPAASGWRAAFGPVPWLAAAALAAVILHPLLVGRPWPVTWRADRTGDRAIFAPAERAQFAFLTLSAAALAVIAVAVSYQPRAALAAAALCAMVVLFAVAAAMTARGAAGDGFLLTCAVAGFVVAPTSAVLLSLWALAAHGTAGAGAAGGFLTAAAIVGAVLGTGAVAVGHRVEAQARRRLTGGSHAGGARAGGAHAASAHAAQIPPIRRGPIAGLLLAALALVVAFFTGPFAGAVLLTVLVAVVTGGLAATLARPARDVTLAGAMAGVVILACGALAGYLAAAAIGVQFGPASATRPGPVPHGLVTAYGWWVLASAAVVMTVAITRRAHHTRGQRRGRW
jgi:hypothetical protein